MTVEKCNGSVTHDFHTWLNDIFLPELTGIENNMTAKYANLNGEGRVAVIDEKPEMGGSR